MIARVPDRHSGIVSFATDGLVSVTARPRLASTRLVIKEKYVRPRHLRYRVKRELPKVAELGGDLT